MFIPKQYATFIDWFQYKTITYYHYLKFCQKFWHNVKKQTYHSKPQFLSNQIFQSSAKLLWALEAKLQVINFKSCSYKSAKGQQGWNIAFLSSSQIWQHNRIGKKMTRVLPLTFPSACYLITIVNEKTFVLLQNSKVHLPRCFGFQSLASRHDINSVYVSVSHMLSPYSDICRFEPLHLWIGWHFGTCAGIFPKFVSIRQRIIHTVERLDSQKAMKNVVI